MAKNTKIFAIFLKPQMNTRVEVDIPYLVEHFKLTESGIKNKFKRTQENMKNRGYTLEKEGRGDKTKYYIILDEYDSGIDLYDVEKRRLTIPKVVLQQAKDFDFVVFTGIVFTDNAFYLGTRAKFLERIGLAPNKKNIQLLTDALESLSAKGYIKYDLDVYKNMERLYITALLKLIDEIRLGLPMIKVAQELSIKNKCSWGDLLRVWTAVGYLVFNKGYENIVFSDIEKLTGLTRYKIRKYIDILNSEDVLVARNDYYIEDGMWYCAGKKIIMNVLFEGNRLIKDR